MSRKKKLGRTILLRLSFCLGSSGVVTLPDAVASHDNAYLLTLSNPRRDSHHRWVPPLAGEGGERYRMDGGTDAVTWPIFKRS
ncbi:hypothetical protein BD779DRAFT_1570905 [Infundibulicybe gibba]|nr:hypothetical protein BD779DRAFT_1570905 [Infundibulicybe gibba]